ncbi:MAG TPA: hypothetical protein VL463_23250 [Kofleriaceae bacterium]|nr:hypothetical protein [Kofleriaceae bacterium]
MKYLCDEIAERLADGAPLGEDGETHIAACPACARLVRLPQLVAATAREPEPGPGFAARMQVGARAEITARRRTRVASLTLATAAAVLVGGVFLTRRHDKDEHASAMSRYSEPQPISLPGEHRADTHDRNRAPNPTASITDDELAARLARVADVDGALQPTRAWHRIEAPLAPYQQLLVHVSEGVH